MPRSGPTSPLGFGFWGRAGQGAVGGHGELEGRGGGLFLAEIPAGLEVWSEVGQGPGACCQKAAIDLGTTWDHGSSD